jgi:AhpD family alkylhydroperoxidase
LVATETHHRLNIMQSFRPGFDAMSAFNETLEQTASLPRGLHELLHLRASILNGCSYCIDMHSKNLAALGDTPQRSFAVAAWQEAPFYTDAERAALALTDALTILQGSRVDDAMIQACGEHYTADQINEIVYSVIVINGWNRLMRADNGLAGRYEPPADFGSKGS